MTALKVSRTSLPGVLLIEPLVYGDSRGFFMEIYNRERYEAAGISQVFVQDNFSHSRRGTVRGLHYQRNSPQGKLVMVQHGEVFDVAVDLRRGSPSFGQWVGQVLSGENRRQLFIPAGFAHGFCVLSKTVDFLYKCTDFYRPEDELGILWNDPAIGIDWPMGQGEAILSDRDKANPLLSEISPEFLFA